MIDPKILALASHLKQPADTIEETCGDTYTCTEEQGEYAVYTGDERDAAIDAAIESYIEENILPEIPKAYRNYFDAAAFKRDVDFAGDGDSMISPYDGAVHEAQIDGEWYYIVRGN